MKKFCFIILILFLSLALSSHLYAKTAIIIANFGTSVPEAVKSIDNITSRVKSTFPGTEVRVVFTSNIIRSVWEKRSLNPKEWTDKGISEEILFTKNLLSTFGDLKSPEYKDVIVQPTHLFHMEQYHDLMQYVDAIRSIRTIKDKWKPFDKIALGRPALGTVGIEIMFQGLGSNNQFADLFVNHIKDAAKASGIDL